MVDKLIADTSFLIDVFRFGVSGELEDYEIFTVGGVAKELKGISQGRGADSRYAKLAMKWIENRRVAVMHSGKMKTDDMIVDLAKGYTVGTSDRELRKRLKSMGVKTIYVRARKKLAMV